jgi:hypothetical protein
MPSRSSQFRPCVKPELKADEKLAHENALIAEGVCPSQESLQCPLSINPMQVGTIGIYFPKRSSLCPSRRNEAIQNSTYMCDGELLSQVVQLL